MTKKKLGIKCKIEKYIRMLKTIRYYEVKKKNRNKQQKIMAYG